MNLTIFGLLACSECNAGLVQPKPLLSAHVMARKGKCSGESSALSKAVGPVCSLDVAALTARAKSEETAERFWDVMHDCLLSLR